MLFIVSLLFFAVIAACSNVTIEFHLESVPECTNVSNPSSVTFYVLMNRCSSSSSPCYFEDDCHIYKGKLIKL